MVCVDQHRGEPASADVGLSCPLSGQENKLSGKRGSRKEYAITETWRELPSSRHDGVTPRESQVPSSSLLFSPELGLPPHFRLGAKAGHLLSAPGLVV